MDKLTWKGAIEASPGPRKGREYVILWIKGMLMGAADLVPGVSGGTIAFITGIYESLLEAVASINKRVAASALRFQIKETLSQIHVRFIATLGFGMACSILGLAHLMHYLITNHGVPTWGLFFGLIAASIIIVAREVEDRKHPENIAWIAAGAVFAYLFVGMIPVETPNGYWFIFLCGVIAISAMILPGLSGSFLLLIFGKYAYITGAIKDPLGDGNLVILGVFAAGASIGLLGFSKVLNWLLKHKRPQTMCVLTGILIGSMRKIWPWKEVIETRIIRGKEKIIQEKNIMPDFAAGETILAISLMVVGFVAVLALDKLAQKRGDETESEPVAE